MKWQDIVKTVAPTIASALGGPLAGNVVSAIAQLFLGKSSGTDEELNTAIVAATPDQLIKLKELDVQFQQIAVDQFKAEVGDRDSARNMAIHLQSSTQRNLSYLILIAYFAFMAVALRDGVITDSEREILNALVNIVFLVVGFWFGSSSGSQKKSIMGNNN